MDIVRMMTMNTWIGGGEVHNGLNKIINAIKTSEVDIVGFQEGPDPGKIVAEQLGWHYYQNGEGNTSIISKYPILEMHDVNGVSAVVVKIKLPSGKVIIIANAHLYYAPYGPYWAMFENYSAIEIIKMENEIRGKEIAQVLQKISQQTNHLTPVFLMGDFNSPSHLDWVKDTKEKHNDFELKWPVTIQVEEAGLIDSYRAIYPDPVSMPGYTWSPVHTTEYPWGSYTYEPQDRIDFIYFNGNVKVIDSNVFVVGEPQAFGNHQENEWPSDHAAVISTFEIML